MTIDISANAARVTYSLGAGSSQQAFTVSFEFFEDSDLKVYVDDTLKSISTHYAVSGGSGSTGTVTFGSALTGITGGSKITITRATVIERTTDFSSGADINRAALNTQLDTITAIAADNRDRINRTMTVSDFEIPPSLVLPSLASRKGKLLGFNSSTGSPQADTALVGAAVTVSTVSVGGSATATVALNSAGTATFALGIPTGATGQTGPTGQAGGGLANIVSDTTPQLGGNLDMNGKDIVTTSNATLDLAPNGTGTVVVRGNTNSGAIMFNCSANSHGQKVFGQPHSAGIDNTLMLPAGGNSTLVSLVSVDTLTNKTLTSPKINENVVVTATATEINKLDGVGTLKQAGKESIWVPAAAMYPSTTNGCSALTQVETTALRPDLKVLDFAAAADDFAQFAIAFPKSWNEGTVTYQPFWTVTGTNTGTMVWQLGGIAVSSDDTINTVFGTLVATTALAHSGTSNDLMVSAESGAVTIAGSPAANDLCFFQINNDASASGQTGAARLLGVKFFFTTDAANDA